MRWTRSPSTRWIVRAGSATRTGGRGAGWTWTGATGGSAAAERPAAGAAAPEMVEGLNEVFETGRAREARRIMLLADGGTRVESIVSMTPVVRYGKVVEAAVWRVDTRGPVGGDENRARLLDSSPAGLLGVDASGRIEAVSRRLAEWVGRRADALEGLDVE